MMYHGWGTGFGGFGTMVFGFLFWLIIIAGVIALVVWAVRTPSSRNHGTSGREPDALEIARRRYARGEINKEQFEQLKYDLGH